MKMLLSLCLVLTVCQYVRSTGLYQLMPESQANLYGFRYARVPYGVPPSSFYYQIQQNGFGNLPVYRYGVRDYKYFPGGYGSVYPGPSILGAGSVYPSVGSSVLGAGSVYPSVGSSVLGAGSVYSSVGSSVLGAGSVYPSVGPSVLDAGAAFPSVGSSVLGAGSVYPSVGSSVVGGGSFLSGAGSYFPGSATYLPGSSSYYSSSSSYFPGSSSYLPGPGPVLPGPEPYLPTPGPYLPTPGPYLPTPGPYVPGSPVGPAGPFNFPSGALPGSADGLANVDPLGFGGAAMSAPAPVSGGVLSGGLDQALQGGFQGFSQLAQNAAGAAANVLSQQYNSAGLNAAF